MTYLWAAADVTSISDRLRGVVGIFLILGLVYGLSERRSAIKKRIIFWGLALQWGFAFLVLYTRQGVKILKAAADFVEGALGSAIAGATFLFGEKLVDPAGPAGFVFAFRVLPTVIFVAAFFAVLYHLGVMQLILRAFAVVMKKLMGVSGAESLNVAASLFLGQTEAPLTIRPYLPKLTRSELLTVMTSGMAHVSGGVMAAYFQYVEPRHILTSVIMTAPGTILIAKMLLPETETPETAGTVKPDTEKPDTNILAAASRGTRDGLELALNIGAMLIAFIGLIALVNAGLSLGGGWVETQLGGDYGLKNLSLQRILGTILAPVAWMLGIPWADCTKVGGLLGTRTILNELIAFNDLGKLKDLITPRSYHIATFALCGFANLSSIGIQLGGIGSLAPNLRPELARLGFKALLAGTLANFLSACIAGILL